MNCSIKIKGGIQWVGKVKKWLKKMERNFSATGNKYPTRTDYIADRLDLTLGDTTKKTILLINMMCPNDYRKVTKRVAKIGKHHWLYFPLRERREVYMVKVIPTIIGFHRGGIKELKESIKKIFEYDNNYKEIEGI